MSFPACPFCDKVHILYNKWGNLEINNCEGSNFRQYTLENSRGYFYNYLKQSNHSEYAFKYIIAYCDKRRRVSTLAESKTKWYNLGWSIYIDRKLYYVNALYPYEYIFITNPDEYEQIIHKIHLYLCRTSLPPDIRQLITGYLCMYVFY